MDVKRDNALVQSTMKLSVKTAKTLPLIVLAQVLTHAVLMCGRAVHRAAGAGLVRGPHGKVLCGPLPQEFAGTKTTSYSHGGIGVPVMLTACCENNRSGPHHDAMAVSYGVNASSSSVWLYHGKTPAEVVVKRGEAIPGSEAQTFSDFTNLGGTPLFPVFVGEGNGSWGQHNKFLGIYRYLPLSHAGQSSETKDQLAGRVLRIAKVVDVSDRIPGGRGSVAKFKVVCCPHVDSITGDVIFSGANTYGGTLPVGVGIEGIYRWSSSTGRIRSVVDSLNSGLAHISRGSRMLSGHQLLFFSNSPPGVYIANATANSTRPMLLIGQNTRVPTISPPRGGGSSGFFRAFGNPVSGGGGYGSFIGSSTTGIVGVYLLDISGSLKVVRPIADSTSTVPGSQDFFTEFSMDPSVSGSHVVFFARASNQSKSGLYIWGPSTNHSPRPVATLGSTGLFSIAIQPNSFSGKCLTYFGSDGTGNSAVYSVDPFV